LPAEVVDLVDANDRVVGNVTIKRCLEEALLHRAVAVLVIRSSGKFVLQQRSRRDRWHPGLWTISSTGHVRKAEGYESAARRELKEELGMSARLSPVRKYLIPPLSDRGLTEREWVYLYTSRTDAPCIIDPVELEGVKEFTVDEVLGLLDGGPLTPDAKIILADFLKRGS